MYGLPVGLCFIFLFFAPFFWLWRYYPRSQFLKRYSQGYVLFLILSGTNPLLLGSIGLTALSMFMAIVNKVKEEEYGMWNEEREEPLVVDNCVLR
jgi:hypothetical protein